MVTSHVFNLSKHVYYYLQQSIIEIRHVCEKMRRPFLPRRGGTPMSKTTQLVIQPLRTINNSIRHDEQVFTEQEPCRQGCGVEWLRASRTLYPRAFTPFGHLRARETCFVNHLRNVLLSVGQKRAYSPLSLPYKRAWAMA